MNTDIKIHGLYKYEGHFNFIVNKPKRLIELIKQFLIEIGFPSYKASQIYSLLGDSDNNYSNRKYSSNLYCDKSFYFHNKDYNIVIFFGKERVLVSISYTTELGDFLVQKFSAFFQ